MDYFCAVPKDTTSESCRRCFGEERGSFVFDLSIDDRRALVAKNGVSFPDQGKSDERSIWATGVQGMVSSLLTTLAQPGLTAPPRDKVVIFGDGNVKAVYVKEEDIGTYTIRAVDDPRTLNKTLYLRLPANTLSFNELVALWEKKIGKSLEKVYVPEEQVLKIIEESPFPANIVIAISHSVFVKGDQTNFEIGPNGVEGSQLYPDVKYTTVDEYLNQFV